MHIVHIRGGGICSNEIVVVVVVVGMRACCVCLWVVGYLLMPYYACAFRAQLCPTGSFLRPSCAFWFSDQSVRLARQAPLCPRPGPQLLVLL